VTDILALQNTVDPETESTEDAPASSLLSIYCGAQN
jgi:hypothetical protein